MNVLVALVALAVGGFLAFYPRLRSSLSWSATVTPLASIMGSGFLVSAPLLVGLVGNFAPLAMAGLLLLAYSVGSVVRFNIRFAEPVFEGAGDDDGSDDAREHRLHRGHNRRAGRIWRGIETSAARRLEQLSHLVLTGAYLISITYYLQLLAMFVLRHARLGPSGAKLLTTAVLATISIVGWRKGLAMMERVERYAVALNFGVIVALLAGLAVFNGQLLAAGRWALPPVAPQGDHLHSLRVLIGLLIIVQGFETSRFLGDEHPGKQRIATMRRAQLLSAVVYLAFTSLALVLFHPGRTPPATDVTAIVALVGPVATWLPVLIVVVAAASQFSAAVADDAGCAGLTQALFSGRLSVRDSYLAIGAATILLTWSTDVLEVISLASRAFAAFYSLQCGVAVATALSRPDGRRRPVFVVLAALLGLMCAAITWFGIPVE